MKKIRKFFIGVRNELTKVRWPNKSEMFKYSLATLFFIVIFAAFFVATDFILATIKTLVK